MAFLLPISLLLQLSFMHPYHVGITDMDWNHKESRFQVAMVLEDEDVEDALDMSLDSALAGGAGSALWYEVSGNFTLEVDGEDVVWEYVGVEVSMDGRVSTYFQSQELDSPKSIDLTNTVLLKGIPYLEHKINLSNGTSKTTLFTSIRKKNVEHTF